MTDLYLSYLYDSYREVLFAIPFILFLAGFYYLMYRKSGAYKVASNIDKYATKGDELSLEIISQSNFISKKFFSDLVLIGMMSLMLYDYLPKFLDSLSRDLKIALLFTAFTVLSFLLDLIPTKRSKNVNSIGPSFRKPIPKEFRNKYYLALILGVSFIYIQVFSSLDSNNTVFGYKCFSGIVMPMLVFEPLVQKWILKNYTAS